MVGFVPPLNLLRNVVMKQIRPILWILLALYALNIFGCSLNFRPTAAQSLKNYKRAYLKPTPELWYGVSKVEIRDGGCVCHTSTSFATEVSNCLKGWNVSMQFSKNLTDELSRHASFDIVPEKTQPESENLVDKVIDLSMELFFEGENPKIALLVHWNVASPAEIQGRGNIPMLSNAREFNPLDYDRLSAFKPIYVGGCLLVQSENFSKNQWLADDGRLIKSEMKRLVESLAKQTSQELMP